MPVGESANRHGKLPVSSSRPGPDIANRRKTVVHSCCDYYYDGIGSATVVGNLSSPENSIRVDSRVEGLDSIRMKRHSP